MNTPTVSILLATYNGADFLPQQLASIVNQTFTNWVIYASDDGSTDETVAILENFKIQYPQKIFISKNKGLGACRNFLTLAEDSTIRSNFYSFCDQDDIWLPQKLERAIFALENSDLKLPTTYFSRSILTDQNGKPFSITKENKKQPSFRNALVQNFAAGNTALFNQEAKLLFEKTKGSCPVIHDWWLYLMVTAANGNIIYDKEAFILYRQHANNVIGVQSGLKLLQTRIKRLLSGEIKRNCEKNVEELLKASKNLDFKHNLIIITAMSVAGKAGLFKRIKLHSKMRLYRQTLLGNLSLWFTIIFNKI